MPDRLEQELQRLIQCVPADLINLDRIYDIIPTIQKAFSNPNVAKFEAALAKLPEIKSVQQIGATVKTTLDLTDQRSALLTALQSLKPWRKGPFSFFDICVDAEWRSDYKWKRLEPIYHEFKDSSILDLGCSNGYYLFQSHSFNPRLMLGIDPMNICFYQYLAFQKYAQIPNLFLFPVNMDQLNFLQADFDIVLFMGVLYHQSSPLDSLCQIREYLKPKGRIVVETLVYPGTDSIAFFPKNRYAKMNNVYFIPTVSCLTHWLAQAGFSDIENLGVIPTTSDEQRKTDWMNFESLTDFLDPADHSKTIEGYPAPQRCIMIARKK